MRMPPHSLTHSLTHMRMPPLRQNLQELQYSGPERSTDLFKNIVDTDFEGSVRVAPADLTQSCVYAHYHRCLGRYAMTTSPITPPRLLSGTPNDNFNKHSTVHCADDPRGGQGMHKWLHVTPRMCNVSFEITRRMPAPVHVYYAIDGFYQNYQVGRRVWVV